MSLQLPQALAAPLAWTGVAAWPEGFDEDLLHAEGTRYTAMAARLRGSVRDTDAYASQVWRDNTGDGVDAYRSWMAENAPADRANRLADAAELVGLALLTAAVATLLWKLGVIAQLVALVVVAARAVASPATLPAAVARTRRALRTLLDDIVRFLSRGVVEPMRRAMALLRTGAGRLRGRPADWDPLRAAANREVNISAIRPRPGFRGSPFRNSTRPVWRRDSEPVYRSDTRHPDEIFSAGFRPKNPHNTDLNGYVEHLDPSSRQTAYVSTSYSDRIHLQWHEYGRQGWVYDIRTPGGTGLRLPNSSYDEVVFPGGVSPEYVMRARPYQVSRKGDVTVGDWLENPHAKPG
ncbi:hypothetical protein [Streptosporangium sp. NPDC049376]|uniref:scabin-related ADP-ribosyltransferase n=1 Tax=Streptosporangium sp. NPDC049376 TaxID=3366192 RepID=UPI00379E4569